MEENRFKELRYKSKKDLNPYLTIQAVADKTGLSKATISQIENGNRTPSFETIKAYKNKMNVSYEYIFGETENKKIEYAELGKYFRLDDQFYDTLKYLDSKFEIDMINIINAIFEDPSALYDVLYIVYKKLYDINFINNNLNMEPKEKLIEQKQIEYILSSSLIDFAINTLLPKLQNSFTEYNDYLCNYEFNPEEELKQLPNIFD